MPSRDKVEGQSKGLFSSRARLWSRGAWVLREDRRSDRYWRRQVMQDHTGYCQEASFSSEGKGKSLQGLEQRSDMI